MGFSMFFAAPGPFLFYQKDQLWDILKAGEAAPFCLVDPPFVHLRGRQMESIKRLRIVVGMVNMSIKPSWLKNGDVGCQKPWLFQYSNGRS